MDRGPRHASEDVPSRRAVVRGAAGLPATAAALGITTLVLPTAAAASSDDGVTPSGGALDVRTYLSADGKTAHDAATDGLFAVSSADYAAVRTGLASTHVITTVGLDDDAMDAASGTFTAGVASTLGTSILPAGSVLLGGRFGTATDVTPDVTILTGPEATGTYVPLASVLLEGSGFSEVFLLRPGPTATVGAVHLGVVGATGRTGVASGSSYYSATAGEDGGFSSWAGFFQPPPRQQYLLATPR